MLVNVTNKVITHTHRNSLSLKFLEKRLESHVLFNPII